MKAALAVLGTASDVGKSVVTTALCRLLAGLFKTGLTAGLTRRGDEMRPSAPTDPKDIARERLEKSRPRSIIF